MKTLQFSLILFILTSFSLFAESYPPEGWTDDVLAALTESEKTGKDILIDFTGSDWCVWCQRLKAEVFTQKAFQDHARENYVLLFLDFPQSISLSEEQQFQNQLMAQLFGVEGFPTIWILDSEQVPVMKTGYREGGAEEYIRHLSEDRPVLDEATRDQFQGIVRSAVKDNLGEW